MSISLINLDQRFILVSGCSQMFSLFQHFKVPLFTAVQDSIVVKARGLAARTQLSLAEVQSSPTSFPTFCPTTSLVSTETRTLRHSIYLVRTIAVLEQQQGFRGWPPVRQDASPSSSLVERIILLVGTRNPFDGKSYYEPNAHSLVLIKLSQHRANSSGQVKSGGSSCALTRETVRASPDASTEKRILTHFCVGFDGAK